MSCEALLSAAWARCLLAVQPNLPARGSAEVAMTHTQQPGSYELAHAASQEGCHMIVVLWWQAQPPHAAQLDMLHDHTTVTMVLQFG